MSSSRSLIAALIAVAAATVELASGAPPVPGSPAPAFALVGATQAAGNPMPTLIVFLDFEEARAPATGPSDSEADVLRSLSGRGEFRSVRTILVDLSGTIAGKPTPVDDLAGRVRAWGLERLPVVQDHAEAGLVRRFGVTHLPAVFLIDEGWIVRNRWDRFVGKAELANAIAALPSPR